MEADDGLEVGPAARQLEGQRAAEAVADGGQPVAVGARLGAQDVEAGGADGPGARRVGPQLADPGHHLVAVGDRLAVAVVVEGEGDVAELVGQPDGRALA